MIDSRTARIKPLDGSAARICAWMIAKVGPPNCATLRTELEKRCVNYAFLARYTVCSVDIARLTNSANMSHSSGSRVNRTAQTQESLGHSDSRMDGRRYSKTKRPPHLLREESSWPIRSHVDGPLIKRKSLPAGELGSNQIKCRRQHR